MLGECAALGQRLLGFDAGHTAGFDFEINLRYPEVRIEGGNSLPDQFGGVEINDIRGALIDPRPKLLEFGHGLFVRIDGELNIIRACVLRHECAGIVYAVDDSDNVPGAIGGFFCNLDLAVLLVLEVFVGQLAFLYVPIDNQAFVDGRRHRGVDYLLRAVGIADQLALE